MNKKVQILNDSGVKVDAQSPVIVSASRSTDIPAFYAKWFINRITKGHIVWYNPFNQQPLYVSFINCKVIVFWTKNPKPIIPYLKELDKIGIHYYFQYTLNDYEKELFEPNVPDLEKRINTFKELSNYIGKERVIWRFDPIIVTSQLTPREILKRIWSIGNKLKGYTDKLVFSFIDIKSYRKVQRNLVKESSMYEKETIENSEPTTNQMNEIAEGLMKIRERWRTEGWEISLATCAEEINLGKYEISHNRCIDGALMKKLFAEDKELIYYLNYGKFPENNTLFEEQFDKIPLSAEKLKDKGQRKACGCMISKDIGMYNTCSHLCTYCYANTSKKTVIKNMKLHNEKNESIIK
jgi:DNA repair photolyase